MLNQRVRHVPGSGAVARAGERTGTRPARRLRHGVRLGLLILGLHHAPAVLAAPECTTTWPHALNVHGKDGQIDHKGQAWGIDADSNNNGLLGARAGKVGGNDECYDTNDDPLDACVGDGPADSLGPPDFREFENNNPPDETITTDTTYTEDEERGDLTITNGATLTLEGPLILKIGGSLEIEDGGTLRVEDVADGQIALVQAEGSVEMDDGIIEVASAGTLEIPTGDFTADNGSDINCGPIQNPSPPDKRTCGDTDGGVFVHSGSGINLDNSIGRGVFYGDGNEGRLQNQNNTGFETLVQGAWTSGQVNTQAGTDVIAGELPQNSLCLSDGFHYAIPDPGEGLTCDPLDITITGHDEDDSPTEPAADTTIRITATVVDGNANPEWSNGSDTITHRWDGSTTSVTLPLSVDKDSTINIDVEEERGPASEKSPEEDPDIVFTGGSLQFSTTIPDQIAGKPSNLAPDDQSLALEALECAKDGSTTNLFDGDKEVEWAMECIDPSDGGSASVCPNEALDMDTEAVDPGFVQDFAAPANEADNVTDFINRTEDFDESVVSFALRYPDAGKIRLHARACTKNKAPSNCKDKDLITGKSNTFAVRPFGFFVDFEPETDDGDGEPFDDRRDHAPCGDQISCSGDASGDVFAVSGEAFPARIEAVSWQAADDGDEDGVPDDNRGLRDNARTSSFGHEDAPETIDLTASLAAPAGGSAGNLTGGTDVGGFSDGSTVVNGLVWDEVGILNLDVSLSDGSYFGAGDATGRAPDVGRFIPARLEATGNNPVFAPFCDVDTDFTYLDQAFGYATDPQVTITAFNANGGVTTNYGAGFWKLPVAPDPIFPSRTYNDVSGSAATLTDDRGATTVSWADDGDDSLVGDDTAAIAGEQLTYNRNGREEPFDAAVDLTVPAGDLTDSDGVCTAPSGSCNTNDGDTGDALVFDGDGGTAGQQPIGGTALRFGRLLLDDAFGPEIAPVQQQWRIEYWTGDTWAVNDADDCTVLALTDDVELEGANGPKGGDEPVELNDAGGTQTEIEDAEDVTGGNIDFLMGEATIQYATPAPNGAGWIDVRATLAADFPHLLIDRDGDGDLDADDNPDARVTFGIFSGESEQIYLREIFPSP